MHQGLTTKRIGSIFALLLVLFYISSHAQLNTSNEIIETIQDIQIEDDSSRMKDEAPSAPRFDEEFSRGQTDEFNDEYVTEEPEEELQNVQKKELREDKQESYEDELKKNANENQLDRREIFPEDLKNFEVDPVRQAEPAPVEIPEEKPVVESPRRDTPRIMEPKPQEELVPIQFVEEKGVPIQYEPEEKGEVLVYENEKKLSDVDRKSLIERTKVEIEPDPFIEGSLTQNIQDYLKPFKERRPKWTHQIEIGAAQYVPVNYDSDILAAAGYYFEDYYDVEMPMPSISMEMKRNFSMGAISLGFGGSYYSTSSSTSDFELIAPHIKFGIYLDTLFKEPYIVPYGVFGYSYMMYNEYEESTDLEYSGASDNFFVALGLLFQLDWLDRAADRSSFEMGIENTYVFIEVKTYLDAGIIGYEDDFDQSGVLADFSAPFHLSAGLKMEF